MQVLIVLGVALLDEGGTQTTVPERLRQGTRSVAQAGELPTGTRVSRLIHRWWGHAVCYPDSSAGTSLSWRGPRWWRIV